MSPGLVSIDLGEATYLYTVRPLAANERIDIQVPDAKGAPRCCVAFTSQAFRLAGNDTEAVNGDTDEPLLRYELIQKSKLGTGMPFLGVAIVGGSLPPRQLPNDALKTGTTGHGYVVRSCTSAEGLHVFGEGGGLPSVRLYLHFDYTLESPSCPQK